MGGDGDHLGAQRLDAAADRLADRAVPDDEHGRARHLCGAVRAPVALVLARGRAQQPAGVAEQGAHDPLGHRHVARAARVAQRHAGRDEVLDRVGARREHLHHAQLGQLAQPLHDVPVLPRDDQEGHAVQAAGGRADLHAVRRVGAHDLEGGVGDRGDHGPGR